MDTISEGGQFATVIYMSLIPCRDELVSGTVDQTSYGGVSYSTTSQNITDLLVAGSTGVNHGTPVPKLFVIGISPELSPAQGISQDGIVTLLTVTIV